MNTILNLLHLFSYVHNFLFQICVCLCKKCLICVIITRVLHSQIATCPIACCYPLHCLPYIVSIYLATGQWPPLFRSIGRLILAQCLALGVYLFGALALSLAPRPIEVVVVVVGAATLSAHYLQHKLCARRMRGL